MNRMLITKFIHCNVQYLAHAMNHIVQILRNVPFPKIIFFVDFHVLIFFNILYFIMSVTDDEKNGNIAKFITPHICNHCIARNQAYARHL